MEGDKLKNWVDYDLLNGEILGALNRYQEEADLGLKNVLDSMVFYTRNYYWAVVMISYVNVFQFQDQADSIQATSCDLACLIRFITYCEYFFQVQTAIFY